MSNITGLRPSTLQRTVLGRRWRYWCTVGVLGRGLQLVDFLLFAGPTIDAVRHSIEHQVGANLRLTSCRWWECITAIHELRDGTRLIAIAPDATSPLPSWTLPLGIGLLTSPRLIAWGIRETASGHLTRDTAGGWIHWSSDDRTSLESTCLVASNVARAEQTGGVLPVLIEDGDIRGAETPARDMSRQMMALKLRHPEPDVARAALVRHGLMLEVSDGPLALSAEIGGPDGVRMLA